MTEDVAQTGIQVVNLIRLRWSDHGSEGIMVYQNFCCFTMELPWWDNLCSNSCASWWLADRRTAKYLARLEDGNIKQ